MVRTLVKEVYKGTKLVTVRRLPMQLRLVIPDQLKSEVKPLAAYSKASLILLAYAAPGCGLQSVLQHVDHMGDVRPCCIHRQLRDRWGIASTS